MNFFIARKGLGFGKRTQVENNLIGTISQLLILILNTFLTVNFNAQLILRYTSCIMGSKYV